MLPPLVSVNFLQIVMYNRQSSMSGMTTMKIIHTNLTSTATPIQNHSQVDLRKTAQIIYLNYRVSSQMTGRKAQQKEDQ